MTLVGCSACPQYRDGRCAVGGDCDGRDDWARRETMTAQPCDDSGCGGYYCDSLQGQLARMRDERDKLSARVAELERWQEQAESALAGESAAIEQLAAHDERVLALLEESLRADDALAESLRAVVQDWLVAPPGLDPPLFRVGPITQEEADRLLTGARLVAPGIYEARQRLESAPPRDGRGRQAPSRR